MLGLDVLQHIAAFEFLKFILPGISQDLDKKSCSFSYAGTVHNKLYVSGSIGIGSETTKGPQEVRKVFSSFGSH